MDDHGGVVEPVAVPQRRPDHQHRQQLGGGRHDGRQRVLHGLEKQGFRWRMSSIE